MEDYIYHIMDVSGNDGLFLGAFDNLPDAIGILGITRPDEPISEYTIDDDARIEIWRYKKNCLVTSYEVVYSCIFERLVDDETDMVIWQRHTLH